MHFLRWLGGIAGDSEQGEMKVKYRCECSCAFALKSGGDPQLPLIYKAFELNSFKEIFMVLNLCQHVWMVFGIECV